MADLLDSMEFEIRTAFDAGDVHGAAQRIFAHYGRDVLGFLIARLHSGEDGREAFASFSEDLWRGLPAFAFRCSARCWVYTLARNAANRHALSRARRGAQVVPLSQHPSLQARSPTLCSDPALRTETKQRVRALREQLSLEDQTLLMLHVDRRLSWRELAQVMSDTTLTDEALARETVRVRKRFERIKQQLRKLAREAGILES